MANMKAKIGYGKIENLLPSIQAGVFDAGDIIFTSDTQEVAFIRPDGNPMFVLSKTNNVWESLEAATTYIKTDLSAYDGQILSVLDENGQYVLYINHLIDGQYELCPFEGSTVESPNFTGSPTIDNEPIATQKWVNSIINNISGNAPSVVDRTDNPMPSKDYKAGQTWYVAEAGTYQGVECQVGDFIICVKDYSLETASNSDFIVLQGNIQVHEHGNKDLLDTFNKTQTELLDEVSTNISEALNSKIGNLGEFENVVDYVKSKIVDSNLTQEDLNSAITECKTYINNAITIVEF